MSVASYHTLQAFSGSIGWPTLQPKAWPNSGMFLTTPSGTEFQGRMGIGLRQHALSFRAHFAAPVLCESKEELLLGRVSILRLVQVDALLLCIGKKRDVGQAQAAVVCGVFTQGQLAIQLHSAGNAELSVLGDFAICLLG